ncbi:MAG: hypothetical protein ABSF10_19935 [Verrucomicrobiota bacterium]
MEFPRAACEMLYWPLRGLRHAVAQTYCELSRKFPARTLRVQVWRKASYLASRLAGRSAALLLPLTGHCRDIARA